MDLIIKEVFSDFKNSLAGIDFGSYNPNSPEFQSALNVGLMWHLLKEIDGENLEIVPKMGTYETVPEMGTEKDEISEELYGAKKYFQKFMDSEDSVYKEMAKDELKHAEILIKKANAKLPSGEEKARLKEYELELKEISDKVNE